MIFCRVKTCKHNWLGKYCELDTIYIVPIECPPFSDVPVCEDYEDMSPMERLMRDAKLKGDTSSKNPRE